MMNNLTFMFDGRLGQEQSHWIGREDFWRKSVSEVANPSQEFPRAIPWIISLARRGEDPTASRL